MPLQTNAVHCWLCLPGHTQTLPWKTASHGRQVRGKMSTQLNSRHLLGRKPRVVPTVSFYGPISRILETFPPKPYENKSEKAMLGTHCTNIKSPSCGPSTRCLGHDRGQRADNDRLFPDRAVGNCPHHARLHM